MSPERLSYRFGPLERRGLFGPVRAGQAIVLAAGGTLAVLALDLSPTAGGAMAAAVLAAVALGAALLPLAGRTADQWVPVAAGFLAGSIRLGRRGGRRHLSPVPERGMLWRRGDGDGGGDASFGLLDPPGQPPPPVGEVDIRSIAYRDRDLGVLSERHGRRMTAVLACRAASFALLDPEAQERRLSRWGMVLASSSDCGVRRLQWIERTSPARIDELAGWLQRARTPAAPPRGTPMVESYLELISGSARVAQDHEILIGVQVDVGRLKERGAVDLERALVEETERVARGLEAAEISVLGALAPGQLARVLRTAFDPFAGAEVAAVEAANRNRDGLSPVNAWPLASEESWDQYRCDGSHHVTYWIGGWPRVEVSPMFMDALLGSSDVARTVSITFEPIPPGRSTREVEAAVTRDRADRELRHRFGQGETARQRQAQEAAMRREAELAAGHAEVRLAGFVTVSARDEDELRRSCAQILEHAARARMELHRMYGQQAHAFTFTLPLARGLR